jgi:ABC-type ATPase with predicted acetyltransferase domain
MLLAVAHDFLPKTRSVRACEVMDHFGIHFEQGRHVITAGLELPLQPGQVVLFTGASGSGKSSLMRAAAAVLAGGSQPGVTTPPSVEDGSGSGAETARVLSLEALSLPDRLVIDALDLPTAKAMNLLSACGLGEAHLMLRTPAELSDGQRYRFRLALALSRTPQWIVADEFTATLDRTLAKVIAFNIRRLADRTGAGFLLATTHEDIAADLDPDLHVRCRLDGDPMVEPRNAGGELSRSAGAIPSASKKNTASRSTRSCGSPPRPVATGRTSLGGITAAITSD